MAVSDRALIRAQAFSGLAFASFLTLHLINTIVAGPGGQAGYDAFQGAARHFYQFPAVEVPLVVAAALVHIAVSTIRILRRRRKPSPRPTLRARLHRWAGYYLLLTVPGHYLATRGPALFFDTPVDFSFLNLSLFHWPAFFYPYYGLLAACGLYHLVNGTAVALRVAGARLPAAVTAPRSKPFWIGVTAGSFALFAGIAAIGGAFGPVDRHRFPEFQAIYEKLVPRAWLPW